MTYRHEDPAEETDHVMPWPHILATMTFCAALLVLLSPMLVTLWLMTKLGLAPPKDGRETVPPGGDGRA